MVQFTTQSSLRIVIATVVAFGMGIDCPDVRQIIHWGIPADAEMHVQESGHAGHDGQMSCTLLVYGKRDLRKAYTSEHIKYCKNTNQCRKKIFSLKTLKAVRRLCLRDVCAVMYAANSAHVESVSKILVSLMLHLILFYR